MNLDFLKQLSNRRSLFVDIVFYFMISLLISTVLCYFIFGAKIYLQDQKANQLKSLISNIGTEGQKSYEKSVFDYQARINDFAKLMNEHRNYSNAFDFFERNTLPDIWFSSFNIASKTNEVKLDGEAENMGSLSRQVSIFENSEYVKKIDLLSSSVTTNSRIKFSLSVILDPKIFTFAQ